MDPAVATSQVRVAIVGDEAAADLALPTKVTVRELIPRIRAILAGVRDDDEIPAEFHAEGLRPYSLRPMAGIPFSLDATLETLGVSEGDALMLCMLPPGPTAPPVIEDIADAAAIHSAQQTKIFDAATMLGPAALAAGITVGTLISGLAAYAWHLGHPLWARVGLTLIAAAFIAATVAVRRAGRDAESAMLGVAVAAPLGLTLAAALPGSAAAPRLVLATAGVAAWSLLSLTMTNRWVATQTAAVAVSLPIGLIAVFRTLWHWPFLTLGCLLLAVSLFLAIQAPTLAPVFARFPFFYVPAPGEKPAAPLSLAQIEDLPRRAAASQAFQAGLIAASVILTVIGSVLVLWLPAHPSLLCWWLVVVVGLVTVLRLRLFDAATPALWFLASPLLTTATLAVTFAATGHIEAAGWAAIALAGLAALLLGAATFKPGKLSIPRRGYLDVVENILLWTILPSMLWLIGLVSLIRNRGSL